MSTAQIYELPVIAQGMKAGLPSPQDKTISANVVDSIGHTPMIRLSRYLDLPNIDLIAKLEASNPGGSAKDRPARRMIEEGLKDGSINARTTIIESSSGNMGIGLAQICRYHGLRFICVVDPNAQAQNVAIIRALGAEVRLVTKPLEGDFLAARLALVKELLDGIENSFWPNQYANLNNPLAHEFGTIQEIDDTLGGAFDYLFVATSSTWQNAVAIRRLLPSMLQAASCSMATPVPARFQAWAPEPFPIWRATSNLMTWSGSVISVVLPGVAAPQPAKHCLSADPAAAFSRPCARCNRNWWERRSQ